MYQALYRKWRPQTFSDMVGQEAIVRTLRNQVRSGRVSHAYLFCGSRGTGKTSAAKILARAINCQNPQDGDPCGKCASCTMLEQGTSLDVYEMDAASNSKVEDIREMLERVDYPPQFGKYKVYIIDETHMLSGSAFNALLKTLEEPPEYMVFILATTEPQKLPDTIVSRCQRFDFGRFTQEQVVSRIEKAAAESGLEVEREALFLIAQAADGSMRDAWSLLDMCIGSGTAITEEQVRLMLGAADKSFLFRFADSLLSGDMQKSMEAVDELMRSGRDVQVFLRDLSAHLRSVLRAKLGADGGHDTRYTEQAARGTVDAFSRLLDMVMRAEADTRWASSDRAVLEMCAIRACACAQENDTSSLLSRIQQLEDTVARLEKEGVPAQGSSRAAAKPGIAKPQRRAEPADAAPDAPAADGSRTPKQIWNAMVKQLTGNQQYMSFSSFLNFGMFGGFKDDTYTLLFEPKDAFFVDSLNAPDKKKIIEEILTREGGRMASLRVTVSQKDADEQAKRREEEGQRLVDAFGHDVVEIVDK